MTDDDTRDGSTNDVEKRWNDPVQFRAAVNYVLMVIALAGAAFAATAIWRSLLAAILVPGILFAGGIGGLLRTYRVWRAEGVWPIWQAASWVLLLLALFCLGIPFSVGQ
ncbi:MAG: hypothetical protein QG655_1678 [Actinomycetota bacterium]|nr:hypothetical protein [Actinomycetota bacterium]HPY23297.1 hypothetical protein [Mycobacterium sp.]